MIAVLVRDQNCVNRGDILPDSRKPLRDLPSAQARVNQQSGSTGRNESRIPSAAAPEYANLDDKNSCERQLSTARATDTKRPVRRNLLIGYTRVLKQFRKNCFCRP